MTRTPQSVMEGEEKQPFKLESSSALSHPTGLLATRSVFTSVKYMERTECVWREFWNRKLIFPTNPGDLFRVSFLN